MQPAIHETRESTFDLERREDDHAITGDDHAGGLRRWIIEALDWLDRYWDDPELRSGFWHSGW